MALGRATSCFVQHGLVTKVGKPEDSAQIKGFGGSSKNQDWLLVLGSHSPEREVPQITQVSLV